MRQHRLRVLLADDEVSLLESLAKYLRQYHHYEVETATDGQAVLAHLEKAGGHYDVVLLDEFLIPAPGQPPKALGAILTKEIKARFPDIEIILFTGWGLQSGLEALRAGAYRYLAKPVNLEELGMLIQAAAEHSRLKSEAREKQILEQLMKTGPALLSGQSLPEVLDTILRGVQALDFDRVGLYLLSEDRRMMIGEAQVGMPAEFLGHTRPVATDAHMQKLMLDRQPQIFERKSDDPLPYEQVLGREGVQQWACVPLILEGEVIGKLSMDNKQSRRPILEAELGPVALFASQAAAAIEHARLRGKEREAVQRAEQRSRNLKAVQEVSTAISSLMELEKILEATCRAVVELFGVDHSGLVLFEEPDYKRGWVVAEYPDLGTQGLEIPVQGIPAEQLLITSKEPLVLSDISDKTLLGSVHDIFSTFDIRSILLVPVVLKEQVLGSFSLDAMDRFYNFTPEEVELCKIFAAQVAVAIENSRALNETRRRNEQLEILDQITTQMNAALDLEGILKVTLSQGLQAVRAEAGTIMLVNLLTNELEIKGRVADGEVVIEKADWQWLVGEGIAGHVVRTGKAYNCSDITTDPLFAGSVDGRNFRSLLSVPIASHSRVLGVINAKGTDPNFFKWDDIQVLSTLANHVAIALESQWLRDLGQILPTLPLDEMLAKIVESACLLIGTEFGSIFLTYQESANIVRAIRFPPSRETEEKPREKEGLTARIIDSGESIVISDVQNDSRVRQSVKDRGVASLMGIPLNVRVEPSDPPKVKTIGALFVDTMKQREFSRREVELLQSLANQVAIAIEKTRLYEEVACERDRSEWMSEQLVAFYQIAQEIQAELNLPKLLNLISRWAAKLLGADAGGILLLDETKQRLTFRGAYGLSQKTFEGTCDVVGGSIAGRVFKTGKPIIANNLPDDHRFDNPAAADEGWVAILSTPLRVGGKIIGTLDVHHKRDRYAFTQDDLQILSLMATQAAVAIQNAELFEQRKRRAKALEALYQASLDLTSRLHLPELVKSILDRAVALLQAKGGGLYLLDELGNQLKVVAVSNLPEELVGTILGMEEGVTGWVIKNKAPLLVADYRNWPHRLRQYDKHGFTAVAGTPLIWQDKIWGALAVHDDVPGRVISQEDLNLLSHLGNLAAVAIENIRLFQEAESAREKFRSLYEASNTLISSREPEQVLQDIVEQACVATGACGASIILMEQTGQSQYFVATGVNKHLSLNQMVRPNGLTTQILLTGEPEIIEDTGQHRDRVNPNAFERGIGATVGLPVFLAGKPAGVMWIDYDKPHYFPAYEIDSIRLYVNQASIAYDSARRIKELNHIRQAAEALAGAAGLREVLGQIVQSARAVLQADSAIIWPYDDRGDRFIPEDSVATGIPAEPWKWLQETGPSKGGTAYTVMERAWVGIANADKLEQSEILGKITRKLLEQIGAQSFQAISLTVGEERLGVLYLNYNRVRTFSEEEQEIVRTFANHAALALKKAKLLDQMSKAHHTAKIVAEVTALENLDDTLNSIVEGTVAVVGCDAVTLYVYDQDKDKLSHWPAISGVRYPERTRRDAEVARNSIVFEILKRDQIYIVDDISTDPLFKERRFVRDEQIVAAAALPLKVGVERVGVIFVNYRTSHRFSDDELTNIELFAHQAAVAIRNAQLYEQVQKRAKALEAVYKAGRTVTSSLDLSEMLSSVAEQACRLTSIEGKEARFSHLALVVGNNLKTVATYPPDHYDGVQRAVGNINLIAAGQVGISGRAVKSGQTQLIGDVTQDADYIEYDPEIRSELAVPIKVEGQVIGVINVEHPSYDAFDQEDQQALEALGAQAAVAIHNAQLYEQAQKRATALEALYEASRAPSGSQGLKEILNRIVEQAPRVIRRHQSQQINFSCLRLVEGVKSWIVAAYPPEKLLQSQEICGGEIDLTDGANRRIGIMGRAAKTGLPQRVGNVTLDLDYLHCNPETRSELALPLKFDDQVIGVINIEHPNYDAFSEEDQQALEALAAPAAVAIQKAKLLNELELLHKVATAATSSIELDQVVEGILNTLVDSLGYESVGIRLIDERNKRLRIHGHYAGPLVRPAGKNELDLGQGITGWVAEHGQPVLVPDVTQDSRYIAGNSLTKSEICVPLQVNDKVIGVIDVQSSQINAFSDHNLQLLVTIARQVANLVENARLYEEEEQRARQMAAIAEISRTINATLDLNTTLDTILTSIKPLIAYTAAEICLWDAGQQAMVVCGQAGDPRYTTQANSLYAPGEGCTSWIVTHQQPLLVEDLLEQPEIQPKVIDADKPIRSVVGVPLLANEGHFGTLELVSDSPQTFDEDDKELLIVIGEHAITAIQNAQLYKRIQQRAEQFHTLYKASLSLTAELSVEAVLQRVVNSARQLTQAQFGALGVLNREGKIDPFITSGLGIGAQKRIGPHPEGLGVLGVLLREPRPIRVKDIGLHSQAVGIPPHHPKISSFLGVPIISKGRFIGSLYMSNKLREPEFSQEDQNVLELLAAQAAIAIENARLYEETTRRLIESQILQQVGVSLTETLELETVLARVMRGAIRLTAADEASILFYDEKQGKFASEALMISGVDRPLQRYETQVRQRGGIAYEIINLKCPIVIPDIQNDPRINPVAIAKGRRALVGVPLWSRNETIGVLYVNWKNPHRFSDPEQGLLMALASQAAVAIDRARQYDEMKKIKGYIGSKTAVDWLKMVSTAWGHSVRREVGTALGRAALLRHLLKEQLTPEVQQELAQLESVISGIKEIPITAPLSYEDAVDSVRVNELVKIYLDRQWGHIYYKPVKLRYDLQEGLDSLATVWASREWLRRGLELVVDNAVWAMLAADSPEKQITVTTRLVGNKVEISVLDTGPGVPPDVKEKLFKEPIPKPEGSRGAGIGLILAQTIFQTYWGDIYLGATGDEGTAMLIILPVETRDGIPSL